VMAGRATFTDRPLARNRPVPIAPPRAIITCCAAESCRASTCSLRTSSFISGRAPPHTPTQLWGTPGSAPSDAREPSSDQRSSTLGALQHALVIVEQGPADLFFDGERGAQQTELPAKILDLAIRRLLAAREHVTERQRAGKIMGERAGELRRGMTGIVKVGGHDAKLEAPLPRSALGEGGQDLVGAIDVAALG